MYIYVFIYLFIYLFNVGCGEQNRTFKLYLKFLEISMNYLLYLLVNNEHFYLKCVQKHIYVFVKLFLPPKVQPLTSSFVGGGKQLSKGLAKCKVSVVKNNAM